MSIKPYHQNQLSLIPHTFDDLIPSAHPVRLVSRVIDEIDSIAFIDETQSRRKHSSLFINKFSIFCHT